MNYQLPQNKVIYIVQTDPIDKPELAISHPKIKENLQLDYPSDEDLTQQDLTLVVMWCVLVQLQLTEDSMRTNIFYTYAKCHGHFCKVVIDHSSGLIIVSILAIIKFSLVVELHPRLYTVACIDKTNIPVNEQCLFALQMASYQHQLV